MQLVESRWAVAIGALDKMKQVPHQVRLHSHWVRGVRGSRQRRLPLATGKPRRDLLEQPAVAVRVLERGEREVGTTLRVAPADARVLHGVVEGAAGVVEDLAHIDAAGD